MMGTEPMVWFPFMMTSSNGNIFRVTGPLCGEFTGPGEFPTQRPVTRSFDVFFDLRLNKRLSKQPRGWWFGTPSWSLWRQCYVWHRCNMESSQGNPYEARIHDDVIKWKQFPRYWPFVRGIHRSRWIPLTKASDAELWYLFWSASEYTVE